MQAILDMDDARLKKAWEKMRIKIIKKNYIVGLHGDTCIFCRYNYDYERQETQCGKCEYGKTHGICETGYMNSWSKIKEKIRMHNNICSIFSNQFYNNLLDQIEKVYKKNKGKA